MDKFFEFASLVKVFASALVLILLGAGVFYLLQNNGQIPAACTAEAKACPDGSYVGRTGPNCEFAACPTVATTTPASTTTPPSGGGGGILPYNSGVQGTVMAGPTCPVERIPPDPACADKPLQTLVAVFRASDPVHAVAFVQSNASGTFKVSLSPGNYMLGAGESNLPRCTQTPATVGPSGYTAVAIECDTGIR